MDKKEWEDKVLREWLKKKPLRRERFETLSGIEIGHLYTEEDLKDLDLKKELGYPGLFPFTRGVYPSMYRGRIWTMRQYSGFADAEATNKRYKYLLEQGQTGLSVAFDLPTQMGYDADNPLVVGEVGKVGVAVNTIEDMDILFRDIPLEKVSTSMTINSTASIILAMYVAIAEQRGIDISLLRGTIQNDILKEYIARGTYIFPPEPSMRLIINTFDFCNKYLPRFNMISISGYHIREAGSTAVQELAFTFANAIEYVRAAVKAGMDVDKFAKRLSFFFASHNNFFEEIAKFRAARRIWAKIMKKYFNSKNPDSQKLRFHCQTAGSTLTAQEPDNNIIRVAYQALSAVLGGAQSIHTNSKDEALSLPTEEAVTIALRTQQILAYEIGVADVVDPLAGSYFIEYLTNEIEKKVFEYLDKIEEMGGALKAVQNKFFQKEIEASAYNYQKNIEKGEITIVGVNKFKRKDSKVNIPILKIDEEAVSKHLKRLEKFKNNRNLSLVNSILEKIKDKAKTDDNLMPIFIEAVKNKVTLGEIISSLKEVWGEYKE